MCDFPTMLFIDAALVSFLCHIHPFQLSVVCLGWNLFGKSTQVEQSRLKGYAHFLGSISKDISMAICDNTIQEWQFIKHPFRVHLCHCILTWRTNTQNVLKMIKCAYLKWRITFIDFKYNNFYIYFYIKYSIFKYSNHINE